MASGEPTQVLYAVDSTWLGEAWRRVPDENDIANSPPTYKSEEAVFRRAKLVFVVYNELGSEDGSMLYNILDFTDTKVHMNDSPERKLELHELRTQQSAWQSQMLNGYCYPKFLEIEAELGQRPTPTSLKSMTEQQRRLEFEHMYAKYPEGVLRGFLAPAKDVIDFEYMFRPEQYNISDTDNAKLNAWKLSLEEKFAYSMELVYDARMSPERLQFGVYFSDRLRLGYRWRRQAIEPSVAAVMPAFDEVPVPKREIVKSSKWAPIDTDDEDEGSDQLPSTTPRTRIPIVFPEWPYDTSSTSDHKPGSLSPLDDSAE